jgi:hypothetical protein
VVVAALVVVPDFVTRRRVAETVTEVVFTGAVFFVVELADFVVELADVRFRLCVVVPKA